MTAKRWDGTFKKTVPMVCDLRKITLEDKAQKQCMENWSELVYVTGFGTRAGCSENPPRVLTRLKPVGFRRVQVFSRVPVPAENLTRTQGYWFWQVWVRLMNSYNGFPYPFRATFGSAGYSAEHKSWIPGDLTGMDPWETRRSWVQLRCTKRICAAMRGDWEEGWWWWLPLSTHVKQWLRLSMHINGWWLWLRLSTHVEWRSGGHGSPYTSNGCNAPVHHDVRAAVRGDEGGGGGGGGGGGDHISPRTSKGMFACPGVEMEVMFAPACVDMVMEAAATAMMVVVGGVARPQSHGYQQPAVGCGCGVVVIAADHTRQTGSFGRSCMKMEELEEMLVVVVVVLWLPRLSVHVELARHPLL
ncbi:hypothetical protein BD410DRAFT_861344 [Rickenella mellea]|uniref:Uncharacterized protein n=1 Tax=Rickenella mellea TaxID=50990 RepID=A0A4Y7PH83_9AGAM|nr:hypothetical protein BD410DRAFT_861344 [Rickenella mellea]